MILNHLRNLDINGASSPGISLNLVTALSSLVVPVGAECSLWGVATSSKALANVFGHTGQPFFCMRLCSSANASMTPTITIFAMGSDLGDLE